MGWHGAVSVGMGWVGLGECMDDQTREVLNPACTGMNVTSWTPMSLRLHITLCHPQVPVGLDGAAARVF